MPATGIDAIAARLTEPNTALATIVQLRSYPSKPTHNAALPYVVFYRQSGGDGARLGSTRRTQQDEYRVDAYGRNEQEAEAVLAAVKEQLHCWQDRPNGVQGCFARGDADEAIDGEIHISGQTFALTFCPS